MTAAPARYPWRFVVGGAAVGGALVLGAAALTKPSEPAPPDNVLEPGSCVAIEANDDAREVICTDTSDDLVVDEVVPLDGGVCPVGLSAYRDRQGMGYRLRPAPRSGDNVRRAANLRSP